MSAGEPCTAETQSTAAGGRTQQRQRLLGRTASSSSVLLSRMRELIREKVVETTVDRSVLAAMERERRQRAADAFVESLRRHHQHYQQQQQAAAVHRHSSGSVDVGTPPTPSSSLYCRRHSGSRRYRIRSDPAAAAAARPAGRRFSPGPESLAGDIPLRSVGGSADCAKSAFREHRSTSEDISNNRRRKTTTAFGTTRRLSHDVAMGHCSKGYTISLHSVGLSACH